MCFAGRNVKRYSRWKQNGIPSMLNIELAYSTCISLLNAYPKERKAGAQEGNVHCSIYSQEPKDTNTLNVHWQGNTHTHTHTENAILFNQRGKGIPTHQDMDGTRRHYIWGPRDENFVIPWKRYT